MMFPRCDPKLALALIGALAVSESFAQVSIQDAWIAATVRGQQSSAAFMKIQSEEPCVLTSARTPRPEWSEFTR